MKAAGLVAAAGRSSRMGRPKALLPLGHDTFAAHLARVLARAGLTPVVVTVPEPPDDEAVAAAVAGIEGVVTTRNRFFSRGLAGSLATALDLLDLLDDDVGALVMCPVDVPFVTAPLVRALVDGLARGVAAVPFVDGERGHPLAFARALFDEMRVAESPREVVERHGVVEVAWGDRRVLENVNTPDDYERLMRGG